MLALPVSVGIVALQWLILIPIWIDDHATFARTFYACTCWIPFALALYNLYWHYTSPRRSLFDVIVSFGAYLLSWASIFLAIWLYDKEHAFESDTLHASVPDMWVRFAGVALVLGNGGGFTVLVPHDWKAQFIASFLGYNSAMITIFGLALVMEFVLQRVEQSTEKHTRSKRKHRYMDYPGMFLRSGYWGVLIIGAINAFLTALALLPIWISRDSVLCQVLFGVVSCMLVVLNTVNLAYNYIVPLYNNTRKDDKYVTTFGTMASLHLWVISMALPFLLFWVLRVEHVWGEHMDFEWPLWEAWLRFVSTTTLISVGGEFTEMVIPENATGHALAGVFCFVCAMLVVALSTALLAVRWERYRKTINYSSF